VKNCVAVLCLFAAGAVSPMSAQEGSVPKAFPISITFRHHDGESCLQTGYWKIRTCRSPTSMPTQLNSASNYFAVGHPSLTNYLEIVGGSNFGIRDDNSPDWHNSTCTPNIIGKTVSLESTSTAICPIYGSGTDAATPVIDTSNETSGPPGDMILTGCSVTQRTRIQLQRPSRMSSLHRA